MLANGRLITATIAGAIEGVASSVNHAPSAPVSAANPRPIDSADVTLRWLPAVDADAELPTYEIRIDSDGELLESWQQQIFVSQGVTSLHITAPLTEGVTYTFAVRARDGHGALSSWSAPETFSVVTNPSVSVGGTRAPKRIVHGTCASDRTTASEASLLRPYAVSGCGRSSSCAGRSGVPGPMAARLDM